MSNVPNAKYLVHLTHQTQKQALINRSKSQKICHISTVRLKYETVRTTMPNTVWLI